ncbi:MAG: acyl-CoA dehydrogenase [Gammaproteobacteria bacterium RIFCSPHIGHO2_12_FULL_35_23]|nr:MAG: acyl-CoA dehydrogenase [Gammaproteobacteria bacterium RIFCSPHIGHO2_12_FULL_35_23]
MAALLWFILFFLVIGVLLYNRASILISIIATAALLVCFTILANDSLLAVIILWLLWLGLIPFGMVALRQKLFTERLLALYRQAMPKMSKTEREALEAGTVWWDQDLFSGRPDWQKLFDLPAPKLSQEEQAFLDGPVEKLCSMINDWQIVHQQGDLSPEVWHYIRNEGFFALIIPKAYGGKEFSALAHISILIKLFSCSITVASTVAVPNSLGPAELLLHYGTEDQKNYYLPRLARGEEIPCFALTSPEAGSDAASLTDYGIVCKDVFEGKEITGIKLNWNKRYITLAPVATVLGLAFKLYDPEHLLGEKENLGITCALIPTTTSGVTIGRRHIPAGAVFQNGPTQGKEVFIPLDWIIGGEKMVGQGWRMLMECLSAGRSISLPASGVASGKLAAFSSGAYARIRRQFKMPIGNFEGIEEVLARIVGYAYQANAAALLTAQAIDRGQKPAVLSGIVKYHCTEIGRKAAIDALDIHGGKGICMGPSNYLAHGYQGVPISITVEGANILTRNMIIFGQGAIRCHPYVLAELKAGRDNDLIAFDQVIFSHIGFALSNMARTLFLGITNSYIAIVPQTPMKRYVQQMTRLSAAFALLSDVTMVLLGGALKRKERISARLGDILSYLYIASAVLKQQADQGFQQAEMPVAKWALRDLFYKIQAAIDEILRNYPNRWIGLLLRGLVFPLGRGFKKPSDKLEHKLATLVINETEIRDWLAKGIYTGETGYNQQGKLKKTLTAVIQVEPIEKAVRFADKEGKLQGKNFKELVNDAATKGIISHQELEAWLAADNLRATVINVDDFAPEEVARGS